MDPLVEQVLHGQPGNLWMDASSTQLRRLQESDQGEAVHPQGFELRQQFAWLAVAIVSVGCNRRLIPTLELRLVGIENDPYSAGEAASFGFDDVADDRIHAPL